MPIIKDLSVSITEGPAPLIVGFFLNGPNIAHRKIWNFGDKLSEKSNNLLNTHRYEKCGKYDVCVDIIDENNKIVESSDKKTIYVKDKTKVISGFDQWQGVIYEGESVGFSIAHNILGDPQINWEWGDGKIDSSDDRKFYPHRQNPHHPYEKNGTWQGKVTIEEKTSGRKPITESREFGMLVLPDKKKEFAGFIEITSSDQHRGTVEFPVKKSLNFQAQVTGVDNENYSFLWNFGDKVGHNEHDLMVKHTYTKSGNYHATCTIRNKGGKIGNKIILHKTVIIR